MDAQAATTTSEAISPKKVQEARDALRVYGGREIFKVFNTALESVGKDLKYSSTPFVLMAVPSLIGDVGFTLWDTINSVYNSPLINLARASEGAFNQPGKPNRLKSLEASFKNVSPILETFPRNMAKLAEQTGKTPLEIVSSNKYRLQLVEETFGSIDAYKATREKASTELGVLIESSLKPENSSRYTLLLGRGLLKGTGIDTRIEGDIGNLQLLGINPDTINATIKSYLADMKLFGNAYLEASIANSKKEISTFKRIKSKGN